MIVIDILLIECRVEAVDNLILCPAQRDRETRENKRESTV